MDAQVYVCVSDVLMAHIRYQNFNYSSNVLIEYCILISFVTCPECRFT